MWQAEQVAQSTDFGSEVVLLAGQTAWRIGSGCRTASQAAGDSAIVVALPTGSVAIVGAAEVASGRGFAASFAVADEEGRFATIARGLAAEDGT